MPKRTENICSYINLYMDVHSSVIHRNQKAETTQMPINLRRIRKMYSIHTVKYYSAVKSNEVHANTWVSLANILLSEKSQIQGHILYDPIYMKCPE